MEKLTGYKKVCVYFWNKGFLKFNTYILELEIPADALRVFPIGTVKCRAEFARVKKAWILQGKSLRIVKGKRTFRHEGYHLAIPLTYIIGKIVKPNGYCHDKNQTCGPGINFFFEKKYAVSY